MHTPRVYSVETYDASDAPDERRPRPLGQFASAAAALAAAREVIEENLSLSLTAGMSAEEAFEEWRRNGEVPTIVARSGSAPLQFDAIAFARARAGELQRRV